MNNKFMDRQPIKESDARQTALDVARDKTKTYAKGLWDIIAHHAVQKRVKKTEGKVSEAPEQFAYRHTGWLTLLSYFPYLLLAAFAISFFWDFPAVSFQVDGFQLEFEGLLRILSISGLIGFLTNWLAITMLFKPAQKRPILGHGLIPAQKERIAWRLAQTVAQDLINPEIIKQKIHESQLISRYRTEATEYIKSIIDDPAFREELKKWVVDYVDEMIANQEIRTAVAEKILIQIEESLENRSLEKAALKAYSFIKGREMQQIIEESLIRLPASVEKGLDKMDDVLDRLPDTLDKHSEAIEDIVTSLLYRLINRLDVRALVESKLNEYDEQKLTQIIRGATNEQLRYIQYLGAVLGTVGGLVIWEPLISIIGLGIVISLLLLADHFIFTFSDRD